MPAEIRECSITFFSSYFHPYLLVALSIPAGLKGRVGIKEEECTVKRKLTISHFDYVDKRWLYAL